MNDTKQINPDSEEYRQGIWEKEYSERKNVPSTETSFPSRALQRFLDEFKPEEKTNALDLGSGNGRNSIFLIQQGYQKVLGIEFSKVAFDNAQDKVKTLHWEDRLQFLNQNLAKDIPAKDRSFDLAIDMMTMHALTKEARENMIKEAIRLLKAGGYFVFYTIAGESQDAQKLRQENPGPEEYSYRFEVEGDIITEKAFTREELERLFEPLKLIKLEPVFNTTTAFQGEFSRTYYYGVFKKD